MSLSSHLSQPSHPLLLWPLLPPTPSFLVLKPSLIPPHVLPPLTSSPPTALPTSPLVSSTLPIHFESQVGNFPDLLSTNNFVDNLSGTSQAVHCPIANIHLMTTMAKSGISKPKALAASVPAEECEPSSHKLALLSPP